jgi:shikimate kinase
VAMVLSQTKALQALSEEKCLVVATGGGAVCKDDNWYIFSTNSVLSSC